MSYPAIVIANEIINLASRDKIGITPMKLQKILYLANGISLKRKNEKLIHESFEAWEYGPVVPSVYYIYKEHRGDNIVETKDEVVQSGQYSSTPASSIKLAPEDALIVKDAWDNAKKLSAFTLSAWSHNENSPWDKAYHGEPKQKYISEQEMRTYFDDFIK